MNLEEFLTEIDESYSVSDADIVIQPNELTQENAKKLANYLITKDEVGPGLNFSFDFEPDSDDEDDLGSASIADKLNDFLFCFFATLNKAKHGSSCPSFLSLNLGDDMEHLTLQTVTALAMVLGNERFKDNTSINLVGAAVDNAGAHTIATMLGKDTWQTGLSLALDSNG